MSQNPFASPQQMGEPASLVEYKDRSTGLILFGVLEVVLGLLFAVMIPFMVFAMLLGPTRMPVWTVVPALAIYGLLAVGFIWLGIGSILARRWARALLLAVAWPWLVVGGMGSVFALRMLPTMYAQMARDSKMPSEAIVFMLAFTAGFMAVAYLLLPAGFVAFYQNKHVQATCERKDPKTRWTDRCPQSVLTLSVILAVGAYSSFWSAVCGGLVLVFGSLLHGLGGAVAGLGIALVCGGLTWGTYRLRMGAWWTSLAISLLVSVSAVVSSSAARWSEMYQKMGLSGAQLESSQKLAGAMQPMTGWMAVLGGLVFVGYLIAVRKHFLAAAAARKASESTGSPLQ